mgnify:CR=1
MEQMLIHDVKRKIKFLPLLKVVTHNCKAAQHKIYHLTMFTWLQVYKAEKLKHTGHSKNNLCVVPLCFPYIDSPSDPHHLLAIAPTKSPHHQSIFTVRIFPSLTTTSHTVSPHLMFNLS